MKPKQKQKHFLRLSKKTVFKCPYYFIQKDLYILPNDKIGKYFIVKRPKTAMIIPRLKNGNFILTKQFRYIFKDWSIEFPAGSGNRNESYLQIAKRELEEECGVTSKRLNIIAKYQPFNGISDEQCELYYANELTKTQLNPDPDELITVFEATALEIDDFIKSHTIKDGMTIAAWCLFKLLHKKR